MALFFSAKRLLNYGVLRRTHGVGPIKRWPKEILLVNEHAISLGLVHEADGEPSAHFPTINTMLNNCNDVYCSWYYLTNLISVYSRIPVLNWSRQFPWGKHDWKVKFSNHLPVIMKLEKGGALSPRPPYGS